MYSVVRIFERGGQVASDVPEAVRARVGALGSADGFVTLLAIKGDDGSLVVLEIFETQDDLAAAQAMAARTERLLGSRGGPGPARTITGEIVFQRGL